MITHETIDGRPAVVAYINDDFEPVAPGVATMIKIIFDDGEVRFGTKAKQSEEEMEAARLKSQWQSEKRRALALLERHGDHDQSTHGNWSHGGKDDEPKGRDSRPKAAVPNYKEGVKARGTEAEAVRDGWVRESPIQTIEDVIRQAPKAQAALGAAGSKIAAKYGVGFKNPTAKTQKVDETGEVVENPKGVARILEKVAEKERLTGKKVPIARVTDTARGTFVLNEPGDADKVIDALGETHEVVAENWRTIPDSHYTDRTVLLRDRETGVIAEIQLAHPALLDAKDNKGGHEMYEVARSLPAGDPEKRRLNGEMQKLYGKVLDGLSPEWKRLIDGRGRRP